MRRKLLRKRKPQYRTIYGRRYMKRPEFRRQREFFDAVVRVVLRHSRAQTMTHIREPSAKLK